MNRKKVHLLVLFLALLCLSGTLSFMSSCSEKNKAKLEQVKVKSKLFEITHIDARTVNGAIVSFTADGSGGLIIEHYDTLSAISKAENLIITEFQDKLLIKEDIYQNIYVNGVLFYRVKSHIGPLVKGKHYSLTLKGCNDQVISEVEFDYSEDLDIKVRKKAKKGRQNPS